MVYRIAEEPGSVGPVKWPSTVTAKNQPGQPFPPSAPIPARASEQTGADPAQVVRLQQAHQAELTQCRQSAFDEGFRKGREAAGADAKTAADQLAPILGELVALKRRVREEAEGDLVKLSLAIARRILHRELNADPESIQGIVHAGLQKLSNREVSRVRVTPSAHDAVRSALERAGVAAGITLTADPKMKNGEIVFETVLGDLDASIDTQLGEIERGFADKLGRSS